MEKRIPRIIDFRAKKAIVIDFDFGTSMADNMFLLCLKVWEIVRYIIYKY